MRLGASIRTFVVVMSQWHGDRFVGNPLGKPEGGYFCDFIPSWGALPDTCYESENRAENRVCENRFSDSMGMWHVSLRLKDSGVSGRICG